MKNKAFFKSYKNSILIMVTRPNLNSCTKPTFISCRSVPLPDFQLHWFRSSYKHSHQPSKVKKVATEDKTKEFITLHLLKFMRVSEEIKNKKKSELQCLDQDFWVSRITTCSKWKEIWFMTYYSKNWDQIINKCNQLQSCKVPVLCLRTGNSMISQYICKATIMKVRTALYKHAVAWLWRQYYHIKQFIYYDIKV